jgi:hypothetical protein
MITHVVMMKFKSDVTEKSIDKLEALLDGLPDKINEIQSYDFGRDVVHSGRSYDFALVSVFANLDMLQYYQQHSDHQEVIKKLNTMCENIIAVDYENPPYRKASDAEPAPWENKQRP